MALCDALIQTADYADLVETAVLAPLQRGHGGRTKPQGCGDRGDAG